MGLSEIPLELPLGFLVYKMWFTKPAFMIVRKTEYDHSYGLGRSSHTAETGFFPNCLAFSSLKQWFSKCGPWARRPALPGHWLDCPSQGPIPDPLNMNSGNGSGLCSLMSPPGDLMCTQVWKPLLIWVCSCFQILSRYRHWLEHHVSGS